MFIVLASRWNQSAKALASRFTNEGWLLLTPRDLSIAGWRQQLPAGKDCVAVVDGRRIAQREIAGVLTLLPFVVEQELEYIVPEDRRYVAAEMTAFLLYWLAQLDCPVLNRPTPGCLSGPSWRKENWVRAAFQNGIPARPARCAVTRSSSLVEQVPDPPLTTVTVIGAQTFGDAAPVLHSHALRLAAVAQVYLLSIRFSGNDSDAQFVNADTFPDLSEEPLAGAVFEYLCSAASVRK
jgi:hypothetical protein